MALPSSMWPKGGKPSSITPWADSFYMREHRAAQQRSVLGPIHIHRSEKSCLWNSFQANFAGKFCERISPPKFASIQLHLNCLHPPVPINKCCATSEGRGQNMKHRPEIPFTSNRLLHAHAQHMFHSKYWKCLWTSLSFGVLVRDYSLTHISLCWLRGAHKCALDVSVHLAVCVQDGLRESTNFSFTVLRGRTVERCVRTVWTRCLQHICLW